MTTDDTERRTLAALDVKAGTVVTRMHRRQRSLEFRKFLDQIDAAVPPELDIHIILDNYGTHKTPLIHKWLAKRPRVHFHFTPTYGSWLSLVERWFAELTIKQLRRGSHHSVSALESAIQEFIDLTNEDPKPFVWTKYLPTRSSPASHGSRNVLSTTM